MKSIASWIGQSLKAIYAAGGACLASLGVVLVGGEKISQVTTGQWVWIASITLAAGGAVFGVTNSNPTPKPTPPAAVAYTPPTQGL